MLFKLFLFSTISFLLVSQYVDAVGAPQYLQVPNHRDCLSQESQGNWDSLCIPTARPAECPEESWTKLNALEQKPPACKKA